MSNSPSNQDHDAPSASSMADGSPGSGAEDLVQSVLADARELLETFGDEGQAKETTASDPVPAAGEDAFDSAAVEAVLDRVGHLVDDLDHIDDAVDEAPRSEPFDLTAVVPPPPVTPDEQVPNHGPNGPEVDLFATEPTPTTSEEPITANPTLDFQENEPVVDDSVPTPTPMDAADGEPAEASRDEPKDEAAMRLEKLLANRLAEEYESVEDLKQQKPNILESDPVVEESSTPVVNDESTVTEEPTGVSDTVSIKTDDNEVGISSTRVISTQDPEPVEMTAIPEGSGDSEPVRMETVEGGDEETTPAEMVRVEDSVEEPSKDQREDDAPVTDDTPVETEAHESQANPEPEVEPATVTTEAEANEADDAAVEPDPEPEKTLVANRESLLVAIGALPYRFLPKALHPFMTPLALSLALWVPFAWAFAFLGPTSAPGASSVLQAGFEGRTAEDEVVHDAVEPSTAPSTDPH
ncbi:MAG: hypothetical protein CMJ67_05835 [Planctomycetaceae bacterium]|nr:hypothetical protein [Planctomycetaceae bacterium]